ncbi:MAG: carbohydrate-binding protein [Waterburya sp.]
MNKAQFIIDPGFGIYESSTFADNSFKITNLSELGQDIVSVSLDLSTAIFPDLVYDPNGLAGDTSSKGFTVDLDSSSNPAVSGVASHEFLKPRAGGFDMLKINFSDFKPNKTLEFSLDTDPTSTKGADQDDSKHFGSISGLELVGATAVVEFADGTVSSGQLYRTPDSLTGSQVTLTGNMTAISPPTLEAVGLSENAAVADANQTIKVTGTPNAKVSLLIVEGALYIEGAGNDIDPFEANTALAVNELNATIGTNGTVEVPVTLTRTDAASGGLNYVVAKYQDGIDSPGNVSPALVLELQADNVNGIPTAALTPGKLTDVTKPYSFIVTYTDDLAMNAATVGVNDLTVTAPDGKTVLPATLVKTSGSGKVVTATYSVAPPTGGWQASDRGNYTVAINAAAVTDGEGNAVAATTLGSFIINAPNNPDANGVIRIEVEDYKAGTNGVEYFDFEPENFGGAYRPNGAVDIEASGDVGGGFNVGYINAGESLAYDVNVPKAGNYALTLRTATPSDNQAVEVEIGGKTYTANLVNTGEYQTYSDIVLPNVSLTSGVQELRLNMQSSDFNINYIELEQKAAVADTIPPVAKLDTTALTQTANSAGVATFKVTYTDDFGVTGTTIDSKDVAVTAPDGTVLSVTLVGVDAAGNGTPRIATYSIAAPGGKWDAADKGKYTVALKAGEVSDTSNNKAAVANLGSFTVDVPVTQPPVTSRIRLEVENYKTGNNGIEFFDTSRGNFGGAYRPDEVDIEATSDVGGGYNLAWIEAGEYLTYDVNIAKSGSYDLVLRVATPAKDNKSVDVVIGGQIYTASFSNTGGWQTYKDVVIPDIELIAGVQAVRLNMNSNGFNFNYVELVEKAVSPGAIRIEAEDYKAGTNGVEYFDFDATNNGGEYRPTEEVDIEATEDVGGGFNVAWIQAGEQLKYDVNISQADNYNLVLRVANPDQAQKEIVATIGGKAYTASFGSTGGFQTYTDLVINNVELTAGVQELQLDFNSNDFNLNYIELVPAAPVVDAIAPIVRLENTPDNSNVVTLNQLANSKTAASFSVTYADNIGIDLASIDASDVTVTAPNGTKIPVTLAGVGFNSQNNGGPTATYSIAAPGGTWNAADAGEYTVAVNAGAVSDNSGNTTTAKTIGKLKIAAVTYVSDSIIRINAGGNGDAIDSSGKLWQKDAYFNNGQASAPIYNPIDNTKDDFIYQSQRIGTNFSYAVPVANGNYNVSLHFSELNFTDADQRIFNVSSEGETVLGNLDLYRSTKNAFLDGENDANIQKIPNIAKVRDGKLNLDFTSLVDQAALAGIVITPIEGAQVLIEESKQITSVTEGGNSDTYQLLLNSKPTANVTINLQLDGQTSVDKNSLVFTPENWSTPQTVTVNAIDDALGESFHSSTIGHTISTTDSAYSALTITDVTAKIIDNDLAEVKFKPQKEIDQIDDGFYGTTTGAWGPDGRLYVALASGLIKAYTLDDNYNVTATQTIDVIKGLSNPNITGIAFNPFENDGSQPKIYVSHNQFYANPSAYGDGGFDELTEFSPYSGQVSVLTGPNFDTLTPLVENIGVSNHDHGVNGLAFDANGDLLITSGSNTNAGIADDAIGGIEESPFTAAILKAEITKPNFNGKITYQLPVDWVAPAGLQIPNPEQSQGFGGIVNVAPGVDVSVYAPGLRNPYDLVFATNGTVYATENDANSSFGDVSLSATTQEPFNLDPLNEINIIEEGNYYGQPNRNRGRTDDRQNKYYPSYETSKNGYTAPIGEFDIPIQGIVEYRSTAFGNQLRGNLLTQEFNGSLHNVRLTPDGTKIDNTNLLEPDLVDAQGQPIKVNPFYTTKPGDNPGETIYNSKGLDVLTGFGGAIIGINESDSRVSVIVPDDDSVTAMTAYEISDWRAPATGGGQFTIGGINFGTVANTNVTIGGKAATISSVSDKRIVGAFPSFALTDPIIGSREYTEDKLLDITVTSGAETSTITDAFQPLFV